MLKRKYWHMNELVYAWMISIIITIKPASHNNETGIILTYIKIQSKKGQG